MKKYTLIIILLLVCSFHISAQTFHAIVFVDKNESPSRAADRVASLNRMVTFFNNVSRYTGLKLNLRINSDDEFTTVEVDREISQLNVEHDDVVWFCSIGHGHNEGNDVWPTLSYRDKGYWQSEILAKLKKQSSKAKLLVCWADACNNEHDINSSLRILNNSITADTNIKKNYKSLFTSFSGKKIIIASSSKKGQVSYSLSRGNVLGTVHGIAFTNAFYRLVSSRSTIKWDDVFNATKKEALKITNDFDQPTVQEPQYEIIPIRIPTTNPFEKSE